MTRGPNALRTLPLSKNEGCGVRASTAAERAGQSRLLIGLVEYFHIGSKSRDSPSAASKYPIVVIFSQKLEKMVPVTGQSKAFFGNLPMF
jgi:hypothetical protein